MAIEALVVGGGAREHELARQLDMSDEVRTIFAANGNTGIESLAKGHNLTSMRPDAVSEIVYFALRHEIGLTVIGPEAPLVKGLSDKLRAKGLKVFGPSAEAAWLEGSKAFAAEFMNRHRIPHPPTFVAHTAEEAIGLVKYFGAESCVIKADGLAGGKGVILPKYEEGIGAEDQAIEAIYKMFSGELFDGAGSDIVLIQERYHGPEISAFVVSDGKNFKILPLAQDHKRLNDNDKGPNTGGMGAYSPVPASIISPSQAKKIETIAARTINGMSFEGNPYQGLLYIGLMLAEERSGAPVVIEYNARFGDPETQVVLPLLSENGVDVFELLRSSAEGRLTDIKIPTDLGATALTVFLAAQGYPDNPQKGQIIHGLVGTYDNVILHHAGVARQGEDFVTAGGRVLCVTGIGETADMAARRAYGVIGGEVSFDGMQYRRDIGSRVRTTAT